MGLEPGGKNITQLLQVFVIKVSFGNLFPSNFYNLGGILNFPSITKWFNACKYKCELI
jgi:hypothetical protein